MKGKQMEEDILPKIFISQVSLDVPIGIWTKINRDKGLKICVYKVHILVHWTSHKQYGVFNRDNNVEFYSDILFWSRN